MAKKKKSSKKKKKKSTSHLNKEILLLTVENLKTKIEWRREQCEIIKNDIEHYQNFCKEEYEDKIKSVNLLEKAIQEGADNYQKIKVAISDVNSLRLKAEEENSYDLATNLMKLSEEIKSYDKQLQVLRKDLADLEAYDVQSVDEKISKTEEELSVANKRDIFEGIAFDKSLKRILQEKMQHTFEQKISEYQDELSLNLSSNLKRIVEETRWLENSGYTLLNEKKHLEQSNLLKMDDIKNLEQDIKILSENCLKESVRLHDLKKKIMLMKTYVQELQEFQRRKTELRNESNYLDSLIEKYTKKLINQQDCLDKTITSQKDDEDFIKILEMKLEEENNYGCSLSKIINEVMKLVEEVVENKDVLSELDTLLTEAAKLIYEYKLQ